MRDKKALVVGGIVAFLALTYWMVKDLTKALPGEGYSDLGRDHVQDISGVNYNSNPPTSGPHFPVWVKKGVYDRVISDGYLTHSLEHGYIVISYNCDKKAEVPFAFIQKIQAHEGEATQAATTSGEASPSGQPLTKMTMPQGGVEYYTPENPPAPEVNLPNTFRTLECKDLVDQLETFTKVADRIVVVPRPNNDARVVFAAWTRLLKINPSQDGVLSDDQIVAAKDFIKAFENKGPEKTME